MNQSIRTAGILLLCAVFLGSLGMLLRRNLDYQTGQESYQQAAQAAGLTPEAAPVSPPQEVPPLSSEAASSPDETDPPAPFQEELSALWSLNLEELREINGDVLGWIMIPGTPISYPLVQGEDNDYYLNRTWDNRRSGVGAIFLECRNSPDLSDFNTIVYGHRMGDGTMFHSLHDYRDRAYWKAHPRIYLADEAGVWRYDIFAAYEADVEQSTYRLIFPDTDIKQTFLAECTASSVLDTGLLPTTEDRIITLSTCTGNGHETRWVVQGVLAGEAARP